MQSYQNNGNNNGNNNNNGNENKKSFLGNLAKSISNIFTSNSTSTKKNEGSSLIKAKQVNHVAQKNYSSLEYNQDQDSQDANESKDKYQSNQNR